MGSNDYSDYSGLGGLIVDVSKKILSSFSTEVDKRTLDEVMAKGQKTVIEELEMMAVLAAMKVWRKLIKSCRVVLFTDSEAVRGAFFKSWSANDDSDKMIDIIFQDFDVPVWIERVRARVIPLTFCRGRRWLSLKELKKQKWTRGKCGVC